MAPLIMFKKLALTGATVCRVGAASRKLPGKNQGLLPLPPFSFLPFLCPSVSSFPSLSSSGRLNTAPLMPRPILPHSAAQCWDHGMCHCAQCNIFFCACSHPFFPPPFTRSFSVSWRKGLLA